MFRGPDRWIWNGKETAFFDAAVICRKGREVTDIIRQLTMKSVYANEEYVSHKKDGNDRMVKFWEGYTQAIAEVYLLIEQEKIEVPKH